MAQEIKLKAKYYGRKKGTQKSKHNDGQGLKKKDKAQSGAGLQLRNEARKQAQAQSADNQMMLVIAGRTGKRTWVKLKDMK